MIEWIKSFAWAVVWLLLVVGIGTAVVMFARLPDDVQGTISVLIVAVLFVSSVHAIRMD